MVKLCYTYQLTDIKIKSTMLFNYAVQNFKIYLVGKG